jgi:hypothetical protein
MEPSASLFEFRLIRTYNIYKDLLTSYVSPFVHAKASRDDVDPKHITS